jgi:hydrogenase maturation protein HypF
VVADLERLYGIGIERRITDRHPDYGTHRWARDRGDDLPLITVAHHHAHAAALTAEHPDVTGNWLVFTWDGTGLGPDDTLWGGEALLGRPGHWQRVASLRPFHLPGGERAGREPWRAAAALTWALGENRAPPEAENPALVRAAWERGMNSPRSSSAGRLFDAAAVLLGLVTTTSWEGEAAMRLEALAATVDDTAAPEPRLSMDKDGILRADWAPLVAALRAPEIPAARRAATFHAGLAALITAQTAAVAERYAVSAVGMTGGVFQNRLLTEAALIRLEAAGFDGRLTETIPGNDGGLAAGQLVEAAARDPQGDEP